MSKAYVQEECTQTHTRGHASFMAPGAQLLNAHLYLKAQVAERPQRAFVRKRRWGMSLPLKVT